MMPPVPQPSGAHCMSRPSITLVGLPLSGKSTVGVLLAQQLNYPYCDLDAFVCTQQGWPTIASGIAAVGAPRSRVIEYTALQHQLSQPAPWILATGGGTPCYPHAMTHICTHSYAIYLQLPWKALAIRCQQDPHPEQRPLLHALNPTATALQAHFISRIPTYARAPLCIQTNQSPQHIVQGIVHKIMG